MEGEGEDGEVTSDVICLKLLGMMESVELLSLTRALCVDVYGILSRDALFNECLKELKMGGSPLFHLFVLFPGMEAVARGVTWGGRALPAEFWTASMQDRPHPVLPEGMVSRPTVETSFARSLRRSFAERQRKLEMKRRSGRTVIQEQIEAAKKSRARARLRDHQLRKAGKSRIAHVFSFPADVLPPDVTSAPPPPTPPPPVATVTPTAEIDTRPIIALAPPTPVSGEVLAPTAAVKPAPPQMFFQQPFLGKRGERAEEELSGDGDDGNDDGDGDNDGEDDDDDMYHEGDDNDEGNLFEDYGHMDNDDDNGDNGQDGDGNYSGSTYRRKVTGNTNARSDHDDGDDDDDDDDVSEATMESLALLTELFPLHSLHLLQEALDVADHNVRMATELLTLTDGEARSITVEYCLLCQSVGYHFQDQCPLLKQEKGKPSTKKAKPGSGSSLGNLIAFDPEARK